MKILVCVKQLPDYQGTRQFTDQALVDRDASDPILNELDEYTVESALQLRELHGGEIHALSIGPDASTSALRKALQLGVDEAYLVADQAIRGSDAVAMARVLAGAVSKLHAEHSYDLVMLGMSATDSYMGTMPAMIAELTGLPQLTLATTVKVDEAAGRVEITRTLDGHHDRLAAQLPALISVTDQSDEARFPQFKMIMAAKKKTITNITLADLAINPETLGAKAAKAVILSAAPAPERSAGVVIRDQQGSSASQLADIIETALSAEGA